MEPLLAKTVTVVLSKTTLQSLSQSFPMPMRLCWKDGMILAERSGRSRRILAWAEEKCCAPAASLTVAAGAEGLRLAMGAEGVR